MYVCLFLATPFRGIIAWYIDRNITIIYKLYNIYYIILIDGRSVYTSKYT